MPIISSKVPTSNANTCNLKYAMWIVGWHSPVRASCCCSICVWVCFVIMNWLICVVAIVIVICVNRVMTNGPHTCASAKPKPKPCSVDFEWHEKDRSFLSVKHTCTHARWAPNRTYRYQFFSRGKSKQRLAFILRNFLLKRTKRISLRHFSCLSSLCLWVSLLIALRWIFFRARSSDTFLLKKNIFRFRIWHICGIFFGTHKFYSVHIICYVTWISSSAAAAATAAATAQRRPTTTTTMTTSSESFCFACFAPESPFRLFVLGVSWKHIKFHCIPSTCTAELINWILKNEMRNEANGERGKRAPWHNTILIHIVVCVLLTRLQSPSPATAIANTTFYLLGILFLLENKFMRK